MSHTWISEKGTRFHYNSDFSGDVCIAKNDGQYHYAIEVPAGDVLEFVYARFIGPQQGSDLQRQFAEQVQAMVQESRASTHTD